MELEKRYAFYHFRKTLIRLAIMILYGGLVINSSIHRQWDYIGWAEDTEIRHDFSLSGFGTNMIIFCCVVAVLEFYEFKNRRNLDSWFSFPLARWKIAVIHFLNGSFHLFAAHTVSFIWGLIKLSPYVKECNLDMSIMAPLYFSILFTGILSLGFLMFPVILANNTFDSIALGILYCLTPTLVLGNIFRVFVHHTEVSEFSSIPLANLMLFANMYTDNLTTDYYSDIYEYRAKRTVLESGDVIWIAVWALISIALFAAAIYIFDRKETERVGGVSDSIFAYRIFIPLTMISLILEIGGSLGGGVFFGIATFISYVIFRRGVKLKVPDIIFIAVITALATIPCDYLERLSELTR